MNAELLTVQTSRIYLNNGVVHIQDLATADTDLAALIADTGDPEPVVQQVLALGARMLRASTATLDAHLVEKSFQGLVNDLQQQLTGAGDLVTGAAAALLAAPSTGVAARLTTWQRDIEALLDATFNPDRTTSAWGKLDQILDEAGDRHLAATRRLLSSDAEEGPLAHLMAGIKMQVATVLDAVARVGTQIAADQASTHATAVALERSAVKGVAYEELVCGSVTGFAAGRGDVTEGTGRSAGNTAGLVGDITVDVDPETIRGAVGRYVIECKDRRLTIRATLDELQRAAANRGATAAVAVFSRPEHCPLPDPFTVFDNRAVVVYDKEQPDPAALRLACAWARWIVQRAANDTSVGIDVAAVNALLEDARRALARRIAIRRAHSAAAKRIQEATAHVDQMHDEFAELIDKIEHALRP